MTQAKPWEIAARLEDAAKAVREAALALDAVYSAVLSVSLEAACEIEDIPGLQFVERHMADALQAQSDKWQAIADAEEEA